MERVSIKPMLSALPLAAAALALPLPAADHQCLPCHPGQVEGFRRTGMGRSIGRPGALPAGRFGHATSGARFEARIESGELHHRASWKGLAADYAIDYAIGSGKVGHSFLYLRRGVLFQSPVAYYSRRKQWGPSPGYDSDRVPDFQRVITAECLFCHAAQPAPVEALAPIGCERCHGDTTAHLAQPSAANIVNPARLPAAARNSVCEQCHLGGEARIPNPGKRFNDFRPGQALESVFTAYVDAGGFAGVKKVTGYAEELAVSRCA